MLNNFGKFRFLVASLALVLLAFLVPLASAALDEEVEQRFELNTATKQELLSLNILTESQVDAIINFRMGMGDFMSYEELTEVGLDMDTIDALRPYTTMNFMATDCSC